MLLCFSKKKGGLQGEEEEEDEDDEEERGKVAGNGIACENLGGVHNAAFANDLTRM